MNARLPILLLMLCAATTGPTAVTEADPPFSGGPADVTQPPDLPALGKWMFDPDHTPAHWLGEIYEGKRLREPINVVLIDRGAASAQDARRRLMAAATTAGYPSREGHSGGYLGYIGGHFYPQLPSRHEHAFSNEPFEFHNNHGRIFGPYPLTDGFLFIGAFSRERVAPTAKVKHGFVSFNQARDDFAQRLDRYSPYRLHGFVPLGNDLVDQPLVTTGDHDGQATLLIADERTPVR